MKKSIFANLNKLIEQAVASATTNEKSKQMAQEKKVSIAGVKKQDKKEDDSTNEADDEEATPKKEKPNQKLAKGSKGDESAKKITAPDPMAAADALFSDSGDEKDNDAVTPGTPTSKKLKDPSPEILQHPDFQAIRNKINTLRGGSSLAKDPAKDAVSQYVQQLSTAEKSALLTYLTNLSQLMANVKSPDEVKDPSKQGIDTKFKGKQNTKQKTEKDTTEKTKDKASNSKKQDKKDDGVIVVGGK